MFLDIEPAYLRATAWLQESGPGRTWDEIADGYDRELRTDEFLMGINLFRRWLVRQAKVQPEPFCGMAVTLQVLAVRPAILHRGVLQDGSAKAQ